MRWGVRTILPLVPAGEYSPLISIETTEAWTRGEASLDQVAADADAAAYIANTSAASAATSAASAAYAAALAASATGGGGDAYSVAYSAACAASAGAADAAGRRRKALARFAEMFRQGFPHPSTEIMAGF